MADIQRVRTRLADDTTITYGGQVSAVQISGCIDDFISSVRGSHDFVVCTSSSANMTLCGTPEAGFAINAGLSFAEFGSGGLCPTDKRTVVWTWDGLGGVSTHSMTFTPVGPFTLSVSNIGDTLAVISSAPGGITCGGDCSEAYAKDTSVVLTATPSAGFKFDNWTVDDPNLGSLPSPTDNPLTITMDRNWSLTANYIEEIIAVGNGRARIISETSDIVVVEAIPAPNNYLVGIECV